MSGGATRQGARSPRHRHPHLKHGHVEVSGPRALRLHLQDREREAQLVVVVLAAPQHAPARRAEDVRRQVLRRRLARAARDARRPGAPHASIDPRATDCKAVDDIFDEQQTIGERREALRRPRHSPRARPPRRRAALEAPRDEAVRVVERRGREEVPPVVFGREREEEFARARRCASRSKNQLFLCQRTPRAASARGAHQTRRIADFHSVLFLRTLAFVASPAAPSKEPGRLLSLLPRHFRSGRSERQRRQLFGRLKRAWGGAFGYSARRAFAAQTLAAVDNSAPHLRHLMTPRTAKNRNIR